MRDVFEAALSAHTFGYGSYEQDQDRMGPLLPFAQIYFSFEDDAPRLMHVGEHSGMTSTLGANFAQTLIGKAPSLLSPSITSLYQSLMGKNLVHRDQVSTIVDLPTEGLTAFRYRRLIMPFEISNEGRPALATFVSVTSKLKVVA